MLPLGNPQGGKGGGGAPPPASQTVTQTSIPEYARPYVENMLGRSEALTDISQNPYQTYGGQRIAGFNPVQEQAFADVQNRQTASQLGQGTALAGASGLGSLGAGFNYQSMATNPNSMAAYMSPYMQNVVDVQKNEAVRDAQIRNIGSNLGSARLGTYGGARQLLAEQERNRNLQQNLGNIQATGAQNAFQAAQQAQQFGTTAGLQGFGQAGQAAATLGTLGQTQFGQEGAINQGRQQVGAIQQAQAQQGLDLGYQDFLKQRNYPYQQLAFMSDMTRGIPLSQSAGQIYTAPPSTASQLGGLGMSALGIYGASGGFKAAEGGMIGKGYAKGGLAYTTGGDIKTMTTEQLTELLSNPGLSPLEVDMVEQQLMLRRRMEGNPETSQIMAPALRAGIDSIGTGDMVPENMAGGGIIAFVKGGDSQAEYMKFLEEQVKDSYTRMKDDTQFSKSEERLAKQERESADRRSATPYMTLAQIGAATAAGTSPYGLTNLGAGTQKGLDYYGKAMSDESAADKLLLQQQVEIEKSKLARNTGLNTAATTSLGQMYNKQIGMQNARNTADILAADKDKNLRTQVERTYLDAINKEKNVLKTTQKYSELTDDQLEEMAKKNVENRLTPNQKNIIFGGNEAKIPDATVSAPALTPKKSSVKSPLVLPKTAKEAVVGEIYNTKRGPAQWDGKQFILVQ